MYGNQLDLSDRIAIEAGLCTGKSFKEIAQRINRSTSTISREVKNNREYIRGSFPLNNDCRFTMTCRKKNICGDKRCSMYCMRCRDKKCYEYCSSYVPYKCDKINYAPYVCNHCYNRRDCFKNRYIYSAKYAQTKSDKRRAESRKGTHISENNLQNLNDILAAGIKKGQPIVHIYENHKSEIPVSVRTIYNYVENGTVCIKSYDLRRKVRYKKRTVQREGEEKVLQAYRIGRSYIDYQKFVIDNPDCPIVQMDTVKGRRDKGKVILTMLMMKYDIMLMFLIPDCTSSSVINVFDFLTSVLGTEAFHKLFPVILTDNGPEFKKADKLELTPQGDLRSLVFYCDPMASWQKAELEKNHEYIRYVIPKGSNFNDYSEEDILLLMNHINSIKRSSLKGKSPYECVYTDDYEMHKLMNILKMDIIPPDDVLMKPELFNINR